jgi:hypothetical protein
MRKMKSLSYALLGLALMLLLVSCGSGRPAERGRQNTTPGAAATPTTNPLLAMPEDSTAVPPQTPAEQATVAPAETPAQASGTAGENGTITGIAPFFTVHVDVNQNVRPISPLIYGVSGASADYLEQLRPTLNSWGGNPSSRYNWRLGNAWNSGSDYFYINGDYGYDIDAVGEPASDNFIRITQAIGAEVRLALPTLGWVAKNNDNNTCSFPLEDGTCSDADGATCKNPGRIADPTLANVPTDPDWVVDWVDYLRNTQNFDIRFYAMDNEPELWGYTHYDVHPTCTTYNDILEQYLTYAAAVRPLVPDAELTGPVTCCWEFYWNSAAGAVDKARHGNQDFLPWFLTQVRMHDERVGVRHLDVLDIHYYPEGLYNDNADPPTAARRLRATRSLWDTSYLDESYIREAVALIPTMNELINRYYPGLKLGISEWNFGADETMNGALAIADVLGIFGREQVYFAAYWMFPALNSPGFHAFKMYTNYDDRGGRFGDLSVLAQSTDQGVVSSYAALDSESGNLHLMLINKQPQDGMLLQLRLDNFRPKETATQYRYEESNSRAVVATSVEDVSDPFNLLLPPYSITLLVFEPAE